MLNRIIDSLRMKWQIERQNRLQNFDRHTRIKLNASMRKWKKLFDFFQCIERLCCVCMATYELTQVSEWVKGFVKAVDCSQALEPVENNNFWKYHFSLEFWRIKSHSGTAAIRKILNSCWNFYHRRINLFTISSQKNVQQKIEMRFEVQWIV